MDFQSSLASTASIRSETLGLLLSPTLLAGLPQRRCWALSAPPHRLQLPHLAQLCPLGWPLSVGGTTWIHKFIPPHPMRSLAGIARPQFPPPWVMSGTVWVYLAHLAPFFSHLRSTCAPANPSPTRLLWGSPSHTTPQESPGFLLSPRVEEGTWVLVHWGLGVTSRPLTL